MKKITTLLSFLICSCHGPYNSDCEKTIHGTQGSVEVGFMFKGGFLDQYDNGRVYVSIVKINDPKDWAFNEYFTGNGFSKDENDAERVLEQDSCALKTSYFEYLNKGE